MTAGERRSDFVESARPMACECCEIVKRRRALNEVHDFGLWSLNDKNNSAPRRNLVLQVIEHRNRLVDLSEEEAATLMAILRFVVAELERMAGVERVYALLLNEAGHVHFHLVPRFFWEEPGEPMRLVNATTKPPDVETGLVAAKRIHDSWISHRGGSGARDVQRA